MSNSIGGMGDEMGGRDDRGAEDGSKATFEILVFVTMILLSIAESVAGLVVGRTLWFRIEGGWIGGLTVLNIVLARLAVDGIFKRFRLSRSGKTLEVRGNTFASPEAEVDDD